MMTTQNEVDGEQEEIEGYEAPKAGAWEDYPLDELAIREERRSAIDVVRRLRDERFRLDAEFQRDFVWDVGKQSRLIESVLMRIPLPVFYVAEDSNGLLVVVDGRQRLTTLRRFFDGELKLALPDRAELNNRKFGELELRLQNRAEDCQLHFYIIDRTVPERARLDIFERVNGGEVLTRQQMRNAIYNGPATIFLREEASTDLFREATGRSLNTKKMQDREFVNRFMSFSLLTLDSYKGDMDDWLARGLTRFLKLPGEQRQLLRERLHRGLANNLNVFGRHAFRKHRDTDQARSVINASLWDVMMSELSLRDSTLVERKSDKLREAFFNRMEDREFLRSVTYGTNATKEVRTRFSITRKMMEEVFDAK